MERDERRSGAEPEEGRGPEEERGSEKERGSEAETPREPVVELAAQGRPEGPGGFVRTAVISSAAVVVGVALFAAGFFTQSLLDDDVDLEPVEEELAVLTGQVGDIQDLLSGAVGAGGTGGEGAQPTPAPLVAATADDDPFIGPADASVTIIEFVDYQ